VGTGEALLCFTLPDLVYSGCWNWDGSEVLFTCKDRKIRRVDPRTGEVEEEAVAHEGNKAARAIFLKNGLVFTTGFTKHSERQYSLRAPGHLDDPIVMVELDTSNGVMFPLYDPDANLIYLCGKGDSVVRYFEITPEPPFVHYINTFQTPDPQRGIGMMSKRGCDVSTCEITRFYRINNNGFCQVIPFTVPRKSELFQEDLYPDTLADVPAITADDWWSGTNTDPILVPMSQEGVVIKKNEDLVVQKKSNVLDKPVSHQKSSTATAPTGVGNSSNNVSADIDVKKLTMVVMDEVHKQMNDIAAKQKEKIDELNAEIRKLKAMIVKHESRIRTLETKNRELEQTHTHQPNNNGGAVHLNEDMDPDEV
jgi:coronin-1B/1C/6